MLEKIYDKLEVITEKTAKIEGSLLVVGELKIKQDKMIEDLHFITRYINKDENSLIAAVDKLKDALSQAIKDSRKNEEDLKKEIDALRHEYEKQISYVKGINKTLVSIVAIFSAFGVIYGVLKLLIK